MLWCVNLQIDDQKCSIGNFVRIWCIGTRCWDDEVVKVVDNGVSTLVKVQYQSGRTSEFVGSAECKLVSF